MTYENSYWMGGGYFVAMAQSHPMWLAALSGLGLAAGSASAIWAFRWIASWRRDVDAKSSE